MYFGVGSISVCGMLTRRGLDMGAKDSYVAALSAVAGSWARRWADRERMQMKTIWKEKGNTRSDVGPLPGAAHSTGLFPPAQNGG